jgi:hypothetical protein
VRLWKHRVHHHTVDLREVRRPEDSDDPGHRSGHIEVDRGQLSVGRRAAADCGVQQAGKPKVAGIAAAPRDQGTVLSPSNSLPYVIVLLRFGSVHAH